MKLEVIARSQDKRRMAGMYLLMLVIGIALIVLGVILLGAAAKINALIEQAKAEQVS